MIIVDHVQKSYEMLMFPFNPSNHFLLLVLDVEQGKWTLYNSNAGKDKKVDFLRNLVSVMLKHEPAIGRKRMWLKLQGPMSSILYIYVTRDQWLRNYFSFRISPQKQKN